jgi:hypothetical protein
MERVVCSGAGLILPVMGDVAADWRTGSAASQASISLLNHMDLPPTTRERGNVPARIIDQRVG